jgi:quinol monooxygenase YgiN
MSSQNNQVRVIVLINAKEGKKQELLDLFMSLVNPPRNREGNVTYTFNSSIEDPNELLFDEVWESKEAYDKHYNNQESVDLRAKVQNLVSKPIEFKLYSEITGPNFV